MAGSLNKWFSSNYRVLFIRTVVKPLFYKDLRFLATDISLVSLFFLFGPDSDQPTFRAKIAALNSNILRVLTKE